MKNINLSIPAFFDPKMIDFYVAANKKYQHNHIVIKEVYGSMRGNTARESRRLKDISLNQLLVFADKLRSVGIEFNYALNSTLVDMNDIHNNIMPLVKNLRANNIKTFTISSGLLLNQIRATYPDLHIVLSTIVGTNSVARIKQAKTFGVERIVLDLKVSRNFNLLKNLNKFKGIEFELMVNEFCGDCLIRNNHYNLQSKGTANIILKDGEEYPYSICSKLFMSSKNQVLKGYWILPQWMGIYQNFGVNWMKITGRTIRSSSWHKQVVNCYMSKILKGNIMMLAPIKSGRNKPEGELPNFELRGSDIDASGYLEHFINKSFHCDDECGIECNYCDHLAEKL